MRVTIRPQERQEQKENDHDDLPQQQAFAVEASQSGGRFGDGAGI